MCSVSYVGNGINVVAAGMYILPFTTTTFNYVTNLWILFI